MANCCDVRLQAQVKLIIGLLGVICGVVADKSLKLCAWDMLKDKVLIADFCVTWPIADSVETRKSKSSFRS